MPTIPKTPHWTQPGVHPVAQGVHRIPLPLPLAGLPAVNVYVMVGPAGLVVIDSGWQSAETRAALEKGLAELGHGLEDIDTFLITHMHWDHYTMAAELRQGLGCRVEVGDGDRANILGFNPDEGLYPRMIELLRAGGAAELAAAVERRPLADYEKDVAYGPPDRWLVDGDGVPVEGGELEAVATPGHTRGHMVFSLDALGVLFTGDHVLSVATPAIGNEGAPAPNPLGHYLGSLDKLLRRPDATMLPAHGPAGGSVHARVRELLAHHDQRLHEILDLVGAGQQTAMQLATALPWTRHQRRLDQLDVVHQMTAVLEVDAHLQVLEDRELVHAATEGGVRRFARAH